MFNFKSAEISAIKATVFVSQWRPYSEWFEPKNKYYLLKVGTALVISHDRSLYLCLRLSSSHRFDCIRQEAAPATVNQIWPNHTHKFSDESHCWIFSHDCLRLQRNTIIHLFLPFIFQWPFFASIWLLRVFICACYNLTLAWSWFASFSAAFASLPSSLSVILLFASMCSAS